MLRWNDLHPYNAVHVVRLKGLLEVERLQTVIAGILEAKGLTGLALNRRAGTFQYQGGPASIEIKNVTRTGAAALHIAEETEHQLNTAFPESERFNPFRFFVEQEADCFALGLVYFHALADAESILLLLKEIVAVYEGRQNSGAVDTVDRYPPRRDNLLLHYPGVLASKLATLPADVREMRRASRPHYRDPGNFNNKFVLFALTPASLNRMAQSAKAFKVTLNDLFLAILMLGLSRLRPDRTRATRRRGIALGCVVNIRKDLNANSRPAFGVLLGFFVVHHEVPAGISLSELARDIGHQTLRIKRNRLYLGAVLELAFGRIMLPLFSVERRNRLYQKHYPLWGGLSNMDHNPLWSRSGQSPPADYFRAVSTGPVTPLVLSIATVGLSANIGLAYRPTVFSASDVEHVQSCFLDSASHL